MEINIIEWLFDFLESMKSLCLSVFEFLTNSVEFSYLHISFSVYEIIFGSGLLVLLVWAIVSFVIDILP